LSLDKHILYPASKDGALYMLNEYLQVNLMDSSKIVRIIKFIYFSSQAWKANLCLSNGVSRDSKSRNHIWV